MFTKKFFAILGAITAILSLMGGIWAFDNHYATNVKVDKEINRVEVQVAGALQNQQIKNDYKFYQFQYDKLTQDLYGLKRQMRNNPNDQGLQADYNEIVQERQAIKRKMEDLLRKIE